MRAGLFRFLFIGSALPVLCWSAATTLANAPPRIPLCASLTIVGAVEEPAGDYEPILLIASEDDRAVQTKYSTNTVVGGTVRHHTVVRTILKKDLRDATLLVNWYTPRAPLTIPGSTGFGTSAAVLKSLKTTGAADLALVERGASAMLADRAVHPNIYDYQTTYALRRVGETPVMMPVTVNGTRVDLPAIRARGEHMGDAVEFHFLDDERNPIGLAFRFTPLGSPAATMKSQVVKIAYRCPESSTREPVGASALERALLETGRIDIYDIYFDFTSDRIREESEPSLTEIAEMLRRHPEWKLAIEGHTDSIGADADNLDLSRRRAASVKQALVTAHGIDAARLATSGHGELRPRDRNDTLEGRARNRRVELLRSAP